jgi:hypothetical protein
LKRLRVTLLYLMGLLLSSVDGIDPDDKVTK